MSENRAIKRVFVALGIIILGLALAACGSNTITEEPEEEHGMEEGKELEHDADEHGHEGSSIDPDAPVVEISGNEFEFSPVELEVSAGAFTVMINVEGAIEHDFAIEGSEDQSVAYSQPGGNAQNTFMLVAGTYTFYCTIPGHREAGMEGTIIVTE